MKNLILPLLLAIAGLLPAQCTFDVWLGANWPCNSLVVTNGSTTVINPGDTATINVAMDDLIIFNTTGCSSTGTFFITYEFGGLVVIDTITTEGPSVAWTWIIDCGALPVELVDFTVRGLAGDVILNWNTATEDNFSHFEVEKSTDGKSWLFEEEINSKGSDSYYSYRTVVDQTTYFRLRIVDYDDSFEYSPTRVYETYPDEILIKNPQRVGEINNSEFTIYDQMGRKVIDPQIPGVYYFMNSDHTFTLPILLVR